MSINTKKQLKKKSIVLLHGSFSDQVLDQLKKREVFVLEGRPSLESSRTLSKELLKKKITPTIISDNMAGFLFYKDLVKEVWLSCHLADSKGAVCPIGSLILAVLGKRHHIPVKAYQGWQPKALLGKSDDVLSFNGIRVAAKGVHGYVPLVEWVDKKYLTQVN